MVNTLDVGLEAEDNVRDRGSGEGMEEEFLDHTLGTLPQQHKRGVNICHGEGPEKRDITNKHLDSCNRLNKVVVRKN